MIYYSNAINDYYINIVQKMEKDACFIMDNHKWLLEYISIKYITHTNVDSQLNALSHYVNKLDKQLQDLHIENELDIYTYLFNIKKIMEFIIKILDNIYKSPMEFSKFMENIIYYFEQYIQNKFLVIEYINKIKNLENIIKISNIIKTTDKIMLRPIYIINIHYVNLNINKTKHKKNIEYYYDILNTTLPQINTLDLPILFDAYSILNDKNTATIFDCNVFKEYFFEIIKQNTKDYYNNHKLNKYTTLKLFHNQIKILYYNVIKYMWIEVELITIFNLKDKLNKLLLQGI
jgi:hypothetical protein